MYHLYKPTYTRAIPKGATIVAKKGKRFARFKRKRRFVDAPLTPDGEKCRIESEVYHIRYQDAAGEWQREKGYSDEEATAKRARELVKKVRNELRGEIDRFDEHRKTPLSEHLADFRETLTAQGLDSKHVRQVVNMATAVVVGSGFEWIADIGASRVQRYLGKLRNEGRSVQTCKHYLRAIKQFCNWLVTDWRMRDNPVAHLEPGDPETDRRRVRRVLSSEEVQWLLETVSRSRETRFRQGGEDRFTLYYLALGSGLRASELASLTPESFRLDNDPPTVVVEAGHSKRRRRDEQPLQPDVAAILREQLAGKAPGERVWPGAWPQRAAKMLREDLAAARAEWIEEAPSDREREEREKSDFLTYRNKAGEYADFHAQRHTYITVAAKKLSPKMAQALARHSDSKLTDRYTHLELHDTGSAAAQLPPLLPDKPSPQELRATGTCDDRPPKASSEVSVSLTQPCHRREATGDSERQAETKDHPKKPIDESPQVLSLQAQSVATQADGEGFEPPWQFPAKQFSRLPP